MSMTWSGGRRANRLIVLALDDMLGGTVVGVCIVRMKVRVTVMSARRINRNLKRIDLKTYGRLRWA